MSWLPASFGCPSSSRSLITHTFPTSHLHNFLLFSFPASHNLTAHTMAHHSRFVSWPETHVLTMAPTYPPPGAVNEYPSPAASRRPSECFSEMSMNSSRRGSLAGFASDMESTGQWQSIGSDTKSPLAQFGFFKSLTDKKTTRGSSSTMWIR